MATYLLDSNACIRYLKNHAAVVAHVRNAGFTQLVLCAPVKAELWFGACRSQRVADNQRNVLAFFNTLPSFSFDDAAVFHYGEIRAYLAGQGTPIGPNDLLIAAIARANGLTLVTHNSGEFSRVPGLIIEDWES